MPRCRGLPRDVYARQAGGTAQPVRERNRGLLWWFPEYTKLNSVRMWIPPASYQSSLYSSCPRTQETDIGQLTKFVLGVLDFVTNPVRTDLNFIQGTTIVAYAEIICVRRHQLFLNCMVEPEHRH